MAFYCVGSALLCPFLKHFLFCWLSDIIGGHNTPYGVPGHDILHGSEMDDVILGDK